MIERQIFARVIAAFADRIGKVMSPETSDLYYDVLSEALSTEEFLIGARAVFRSHSYNTWPAPQQFIDAAKPTPAIDAESVIRAIEKLAVYSPHAGMIYPVVPTVRSALGDAVAEAYAAAGGSRIFADEGTTLDIARREFRVALKAVSSQPALPSRSTIPLLEGGTDAT